MGAATGVGTERHGGRLPWEGVLLSAIAAVSWALIGMAGTAALGLRLLEADSAGSLGPMTAAVVALGAGGSLAPSGDLSAFGLKGAETHAAVEITPLGVGLVGALLLSWFFLRSLRGSAVVLAPSELLARAGAVVALFVAMPGGLAWAGHDVVTIDGGALGDLGDIGGLLPDRIGDPIDAKAAVGFILDTAPTLLGGLGWSAGVLLIALPASRRTPLPRGPDAVHRVVRPVASALIGVLVVAVVAGLAAAAYAAIGDDHPRCGAARRAQRGVAGRPPRAARALRRPGHGRPDRIAARSAGPAPRREARPARDARAAGRAGRAGVCRTGARNASSGGGTRSPRRRCGPRGRPVCAVTGLVGRGALSKTIVGVALTQGFRHRFDTYCSVSARRTSGA